MIKLLFGAGLATAACTYLIAPEKPGEGARIHFAGRNYAHRGLHDMGKGVPENSLAAFRAARDMGFGIELDIQLSKDGQVVVFHDCNLKRMCGVDLAVDSLTYDELLQFRLVGTDEKIPLFSEVLQLMGGRQPLIVELKTFGHRSELCSRALTLMRTYQGELCMESFDPFIVAWFRRNAPDIVRGQLTMVGCRKERKSSGINAVLIFALSHVMTNCLSRPNFIAHKLGKKTFAVRLAEHMGAMRFAWTSHMPGNEQGNDSVIFEGYLPEPSFNQKYSNSCSFSIK